jgi:preprotein translocase subunit SecG
LALILLSNFVAPKINAVDTSSQIENTIENREVPATPVQPAAAKTTDTVQ